MMLFDTLKELVISVKARAIVQFLLFEIVLRIGCLKTFGPVDEVRVSLGKAGLIAQPGNNLMATQSRDQEFVKPRALRLCFYLGVVVDKAPE